MKISKSAKSKQNSKNENDPKNFGRTRPHMASANNRGDGSVKVVRTELLLEVDINLQRFSGFVRDIRLEMHHETADTGDSCRLSRSYILLQSGQYNFNKALIFVAPIVGAGHVRAAYTKNFVASFPLLILIDFHRFGEICNIEMSRFLEVRNTSK